MHGGPYYDITIKHSNLEILKAIVSLLTEFRVSQNAVGRSTSSISLYYRKRLILTF
jgi:hypothetical protein